MLAVQIARSRGPGVIGTASAKHHDDLRARGCARVLDDHAGRISQQLGEKVDAVVGLVGSEALAEAPAQAKSVARVVSIVDGKTALGMGGKHLFMRARDAHLDALDELADAGRLEVDLAERLPLSLIADAHRMTEQGHTRGKIVVTIPG